MDNRISCWAIRVLFVTPPRNRGSKWQKEKKKKKQPTTQKRNNIWKKVSRGSLNMRNTSPKVVVNTDELFPRAKVKFGSASEKTKKSVAPCGWQTNKANCQIHKRLGHKITSQSRRKNVSFWKSTVARCVMFWPSTRPQKMLFQGDAPEGSDTFQWPVIERDRVGGLRLIIWDKVKVPLCQYRLMHRKRVTSELHDSYFRLMTIKHSISKIQWAIVWALNYYLTQLSSSPRSSCQ